MENKFLEYYKNEKDKLNDYINDFNNSLIKKDNSFLKENLCLFKELNTGGKLIRGTLINLGYNLLQENNTNYSYDLALAFEIFQTAILIHDDIIDNDDLRRGKQTIHKFNQDKYSDKHLGESIAICMGDLGFYESIKIISNSYSKDPNLGKIITYFSDIVLKTIDGELLDVITPFKEINKITNTTLEKDIMEIYKLKTAYYTITGPLSLGLLLAGANDKMLNQVEEFGYNVGVAFQLQDDYLGIFGDNIGKTIGSDIKEFKTTLLYSQVKQNKKYYNELLKYYGKDVNNKNIEKVKEIFIKSKSVEYVKKLIDNLYKEAIINVDNMNFLNRDKKEILKGLVTYLKERNK